MLNVLTLAEADGLLAGRFQTVMEAETVPLSHARGRTLRGDVAAREDLPAFTRSSVDGYALMARDTFGCSESMPALLKLAGRVDMGHMPACRVEPDTCVYVPTGGALPEGADAMVMLEYAERFGDCMAIQKPAAPGQHLVWRGDDARAGEVILHSGRVLTAADIGAAAALGYDTLCVSKRPRVSVLSTGDEIVPVSALPLTGQLRDVNGPMLAAQAESCGAEARYAGIVPDDDARLAEAISGAVKDAALVLLSGGSSAGEKDAAARVIASLGTLHFHGLALKPGKPALAGEVAGVPVICLPGHPAAAYTVFDALVRPMLNRMLGAAKEPVTLSARLTENIPSNHGREEVVPVTLCGGGCTPLISKSGLITSLTKSRGTLRIPRDCEGLEKGAEVEVRLWENA